MKLLAPRPSAGIYLVHKPAGPTSFRVVQRFHAALEATPGRRLQVAHGGTLDPFAHGLLLVLVGQATRLFNHLHDVPKVYEAELGFGAETDTGDLLGRVVGGAPQRAAAVTPSEVEAASRALLGWTEQVPPSTSAKRVDGERAYARVHRGERVTLPPSRVYLHEARWLGTDRVRLVVRGGYYVRAFARDVGRALGCGAHLKALRRAAIGPWEDPGPLLGEHGPITGDGLLPWLPSRLLSDAELGALRVGEAIAAGGIQPASWRQPAGFPWPDGPVRGLHQGRLGMLLGPAAEGDERLRSMAELRGL